MAIAVRDGAELFLVGQVCRGPKGDVYVNYPQHQPPHSKPHTSYHASGQHHEKNADYMFAVRKRQAPDAKFAGKENVVTFGLAAGEARAINVPCDPNKYTSVFEVGEKSLPPEKYHMHLAIDFASTNEGSTAVGTILQEAVHSASTPRILVTLFETKPT
jgi:hypothetical protein